MGGRDNFLNSHSDLSSPPFEDQKPNRKGKNARTRWKAQVVWRGCWKSGFYHCFLAGRGVSTVMSQEKQGRGTKRLKRQAQNSTIFFKVRVFGRDEV